MNSTKLTPQQLGDLKREFANLMIGDMSPKAVSYTHLTLPTIVGV